MTAKLEIRRCPHNVYAIMTDAGDGSGVRLTRVKCCGRWELVMAFDMRPSDLREAAETLANLADEPTS